MSAPKYYLVGEDPDNSRAHIVHEKRDGRVVFVWRGFPVPNSTRMKLYPKGLHYSSPLPDGIERKAFIIGSAELYRERVESNSAERARIETARAAMSAAVAPKKPEIAPVKDDSVQITLFGYSHNS